MDLSRRYQEKYMLNTASAEEKEEFKKRWNRYLLISIQQEQKEDFGFTLVSLDESFFFYDLL